MTSQKSKNPLLLGTRASTLAQWQAEWVAARLGELGTAVELVSILTHGDRNKEAKIGSLAAQNVFTKEIQNALLDGRIDLAVHSLKDLATAPVPGLTLAAVPERGPVGDVLVWPEGGGFDSLAAGAVVGTGSPRRRAQLLHLRPDLQVRDIRGNVETRLAKLEEGRYDAVILAEAGLRRLALDRWIGEILPMQVMLPAVGQGALGIETRADDAATQAAVAVLDHAATRAAVTAERALMAALEGGCQTPIAAWARIEHGRLILTARVLSLDGRTRLDAELSTADMQDAQTLGQKTASELSAKGAGQLIKESRA